MKDVRELRKALEARTTPYTFAEISDIVAKATPPAKKEGEGKKAQETKPAEKAANP